MNTILQILKLNEPRSGEKNGRPWTMQDAECIIFDADGTADQVGVLLIPKALMGVVSTGTFSGSFALRANTSREGQRRIEAVLTGLVPVQKTARGYVAVEAPKAAS